MASAPDNRRSLWKQVSMAMVQEIDESLMADAQQARSLRNYPTRSLEGLFDESCFIASHHLFKCSSGFNLLFLAAKAQHLC